MQQLQLQLFRLTPLLQVRTRGVSHPDRVRIVAVAQVKSNLSALSRSSLKNTAACRELRGRMSSLPSPARITTCSCVTQVSVL